MHSPGTVEGQSPPAIVPTFSPIGWAYASYGTGGSTFSSISRARSASMIRRLSSIALTPCPSAAWPAIPSIFTWNHRTPTWEVVIEDPNGSVITAASAA